MSGPKVVALGGGHGLSASLGALRQLTDQLTAVVTVADDGGSSGRLRTELGVLPPGDLRMALAALCADNDWGSTWRDVLQHRFASNGELHHHALGNLLIVALWELLGDTVQGLEWVGRLLGAQGQVLPMSAIPLHIEAMVSQLVTDDPTRQLLVHGQSAVATTTGQVQAVRLVPADPPACPPAVTAILAADWVVLGPGSWFTSVMPHLLVPQLRQALCETSARRCITLNLIADEETGTMRPQELLAALTRHAQAFSADIVLVDPSVIDDRNELTAAAAALGAQLMIADVADPARPGIHEAARLSAAFRAAML